jgi:hypothetical protein
MNELEKVHAAQAALLEYMGEQVAVGISRTPDGGYALAVRIQVELPEGVTVPSEFQGYPVEAQFIGIGYPQSG